MNNLGHVQNKSLNRVMNEALNSCGTNAQTPLSSLKQVVSDLQEQISHLYQSINSLRDTILGGPEGSCEQALPCSSGLDGDLRNAVERLRMLNALVGDLVSRF